MKRKINRETEGKGVGEEEVEGDELEGGTTILLSHSHTYIRRFRFRTRNECP